MLKRLFSVGAAVLAALTTGCGDGPTTMPGGYRSPATWSSLVAATVDGPLLVTVYGNPFGGDDSQFRHQVAESMTDRVFGRRTTFTANRDLAPHPQFRAVIAFNTPADLGAHKLCSGQVPTAAHPGDRLTVLGAFCQDDTLLASVRGWVGQVSGPSDKRFGLLMAQMTRELFGDPP